MAADEWRPPSTLTEKTGARLSLATLATLVGTVAVGGWVARERLGSVEYEVKSLASVVADLPRKPDLRELEHRLSGMLRRQMKSAILRCPRQARHAGAWMDCQVLFPEE